MWRLYGIANCDTNGITYSHTYSCTNGISNGVSYGRPDRITDCVAIRITHSRSVGFTYVSTHGIAYDSTHTTFVQRHPRRSGCMLSAPGTVWEHSSVTA